MAEKELQAVPSSGENVSVNSASDVIARNLSTELKDFASVADVLHMFDCLVLLCSRKTRILDFGQCDFGQFDFGQLAEIELAEVEIGPFLFVFCSVLCLKNLN